MDGVRGIFFFFSSRRRHTRFDCDWSSDVCSSDLDLDDATLQRVLDVILKGTILVSQAAYPHLKARGGAIVNIASVSGMAGGGVSRPADAGETRGGPPTRPADAAAQGGGIALPPLPAQGP